MKAGRQNQERRAELKFRRRGNGLKSLHPACRGLWSTNFAGAKATRDGVDIGLPRRLHRAHAIT
jgi:hypothetical protein